MTYKTLAYKLNTCKLNKQLLLIREVLQHCFEPGSLPWAQQCLGRLWQEADLESSHLQAKCYAVSPILLKISADLVTVRHTGQATREFGLAAIRSV